MAKSKSKPDSTFVGRWDIVSMTEWDEDVINEDVQAYIEFEPQGTGHFQFIYVKGNIDYDETTREGKPAVEFSWEGNDEMDEASGRGWAVLEGDELEGLIAFHQGDKSGFTAERADVTPKAKPKAAKAKPKAAKAKPKAAKAKPKVGAKGSKPKAKGVEGPKAKTKVYQLKITLKDTKPPVWRRVLVPNCTLDKLHDVIQAAMGWDNYHLHEFEIGGERYTDPESAGEMDAEVDAESELDGLITKEKSKFTYNYDFGDDWRHEILVEKILPPGEGVGFALCVDGKRACPPEDCGGPWGYLDFVDAISDPSHEQHKELLEWVGGEFDPEEFDPEEVNKRLRTIVR
jgi:Plasmid pRiA4b ORF-3-like protein